LIWNSGYTLKIISSIQSNSKADPLKKNWNKWKNLFYR